MEENRNEIIVVDEIENEDVQTENNNVGKIVAGIGALVLVGAGAVVLKNRKKLEARRVEKLRKKGYVITCPEEETEDVVEESEEK